MQPTNTKPKVDPTALALSRSIRSAEGGDYNNINGDNGTSAGAYQFNNGKIPLKKGEIPANFKSWATELKLDPNDFSQTNQDHVAYERIKQKLDAGQSQSSIAAEWNSGLKTNWETHKGDTTINGKTINYDTPAYVAKVQKYYQEQLQGGQTPQSVISTAEASGAQPDQNTPDTYGATFKANASDSPLMAGAKAVGNVPSSAVNLIGGLVKAVTHPKQTIEGIGNAIYGAGEKLGKVIIDKTSLGDIKLSNGMTAREHMQSLPKDKQEQTFEAITKSMKDRYGSLENAQRSATNDPVGVGADILAILEGGATLADKALGTTGADIARTTAETNAKKFADTGINVMPKVGPGKVSGILNKGLTTIASPVASGIKAITSAPAKLAGQTLGIETGVGYDPIRQGLQASSQGGDAMKAFTQALRGNTSPEELVNQARTALGQVVETRNTNYKNMLSGLKTDTSTYDISQIVQQVDKKLKDFGVIKNTDGTLDFSRSTIGEGTDATKIQQIYDDVNNWGTKPGDRTAVGIDTLKKRIGNYYSPNSDIRSFVTSTKKATSNVLENAPGYTTEMKNYAEMSDSISEIQKALSLGDTASVETSFKKLTSALKNNDFRKQVITGLDADTGGQLLNQIAGQRLSSIMPRGLAGVFAGGIGGLTAVTAGVGGILPLMGLAITTSPRIVGEFIRALGLGVQGTNKLMQILNKFSVPIVAGGEISNRANPGIIQNPMSKPELQSKIPGLFGGNINQ